MRRNELRHLDTAIDFMTCTANNNLADITSNFLFQEISHNNQAVIDYIDRYGGFIWKIVEYYTYSTVEAEEIVREVFLDIWKNAGDFDCNKNDDCKFIMSLIRNRLRNVGTIL